MTKEWFGVKILYRVDLEGERVLEPSHPLPPGVHEVEESVVLIRATSSDEALELATKIDLKTEEQWSGGTNAFGQTLRMRWVQMDAHTTSLEELVEGSEVYSSISVWVERSDNELIATFFPEGDIPNKDLPGDYVFLDTKRRETAEPQKE